MNPPIVIIEGFDISVHPSADQVVKFLEPVDIKNGIYSAYDSDGYLLELSVIKAVKMQHFFLFNWLSYYERVQIQDLNPKINRSDELVEKIIVCLKYKEKASENLEGIPLKELIWRLADKMPWHFHR